MRKLILPFLCVIILALSAGCSSTGVSGAAAATAADTTAVTGTTEDTDSGAAITAPSDKASSGTASSDAASLDTVSPGTASSDAASLDTVSPGAASSGAVSSGMASSDTASSGMVSSGTISSGTAPLDTVSSTPGQGTCALIPAEAAPAPPEAGTVTASETSGSPGTKDFWGSVSSLFEYPQNFADYAMGEHMGANAEELLHEGLKYEDSGVRWYCAYKILEYLNKDNRNTIREELQPLLKDSRDYTVRAARFALEVVNGTYRGEGFVRSPGGRRVVFERFPEPLYADGVIFLAGGGNLRIIYKGFNAGIKKWSPDGQYIALTSWSRYEAHTFAVNVGTGEEYAPDLIEFIKKNADRYDFKTGENMRPDPYVNFLEWSPDSRKLLLSYSFTDDGFQTETGAVVYDLDKKATVWLCKLSTATSDHPEPEKPAAFSWDSPDFGYPGAAATADIMNGRGVYNRKALQEAAEKFAGALNKNDADMLRTLTDPSMPDRFTDSGLKTALDHYRAYFRDLEIIRCEFQGLDPYAQQTAIYRFYNGDWRYRDISFRYGEGKGYLCTDSFLYYSDYAEKLVKAFMDALTKEDKKSLKSVLTEDDLVYSTEKAAKVIKNYKQKFDLDTLSFSFTGNVDANGGFIYAIIGKKDGGDAEHELSVIHGDGLAALRDGWIPPIR